MNVDSAVEMAKKVFFISLLPYSFIGVNYFLFLFYTFINTININNKKER